MPNTAHQPLDISPDIAAARAYAHRVRSACDELHANPYDTAARANVIALIVNDSTDADAALARALTEHNALQ